MSSIPSLSVYLDGNAVCFASPRSTIPVFAESAKIFTPAVIQAIGRGGVRASLGIADASRRRTLRLESDSGEILFEETIRLSF